MAAQQCYGANMIRTQIQLPPTKYERLRRVAARRHQSMAECIRESVDSFLEHAENEEEDLAALAGSFHATADPKIKDHDRWWADAALPRSRKPRA